MIELILKTGGKNMVSSRKLIEILRKLTSGKRFLKSHLEFIYQSTK